MKTAVFFDIDGTLAIRRDVPESAAHAVRKIREKGTLVFLCTGRNPSYVLHHFRDYADGFICANGRYAFLSDTVLYDHPIAEETLKTIMDKAASCGCGTILFGLANAWYAGSEEGRMCFAEAHAGEPISDFRSFEALDPVYTMGIWFADEAALKEAQRQLADICLFNPHLPYPTADTTVFGHDKGDALRAVCRQLDIPAENTYAFGDGVNDLCMFQAAGHSIAMGNAADALKAAAEYVTADILEDGLALGLRHFHLF